MSGHIYMPGTCNGMEATADAKDIRQCWGWGGSHHHRKPQSVLETDGSSALSLVVLVDAFLPLSRVEFGTGGTCGDCTNRNTTISCSPWTANWRGKPTILITSQNHVAELRTSECTRLKNRNSFVLPGIIKCSKRQGVGAGVDA